MRVMMELTLKILLFLATILSVSEGHSKQFQLLRNVVTSSVDSLRRSQQVLRRDIMSDIQLRLVPHLRRELKEEILDDLKNKIQEHPPRQDSSNILSQVRNEMKKDVRNYVNSDLRNELRKDIVGGMRQEIQEEIRKGLAQFLRSSLREELMADLRREMKQEVQSSMVGYLADTLREDVIRQVESGGPLKVQTKLTPYQRRVIKDSVMNDVKGEIHAGLQDKHLQEKLKKDIMHNLKGEMNGAQAEESMGLKEEIMKDVRTEVSHMRPNDKFKREIKEDIMDAVRREIESVHQSEREHPGTYDRMTEFMERMNEIVEDNANKLDDVPSQETVHTLTKKVKHLERKLKTIAKGLNIKLTKKKKKHVREQNKENVILTPTEDRYLTQGQDKRDLSSTRPPENLLRKDKRSQMTRRQIQTLRQRQVDALMRQHNQAQTDSRDRTESVNSFDRHESADGFNRKQPGSSFGKHESASRTIDSHHFDHNVAQEPPIRDPLLAPATIIQLEPEPPRQENGNTQDLKMSSFAKVQERYPNVDRLLIAKQNHSHAFFVDIKTADLSNLSSSLGEHVGDIAYDEVGRRIYWSDWRIDAIFSYSLVDDEQVLIKPNTLSYGIEVDTERRVVVCSDYWSRTIFTMDIDMAGDSSRSIHQVVRIDEGNPMRIALDSKSKRIYVSVSYTKILQINYETGRIRTMVEMQRSFINSLALNPHTKTLYFNNFTSVMAKRVNRRKKDPVTVFHISGKEPSALLVHKDQVFVVYHNSADLDVVRSNRTDPELFKEMPFTSGHLRTSMCLVPAH